jgi:hypothetical protein
MDMWKNIRLWIISFLDFPIINTSAPFLLCVLFAVNGFRHLGFEGTLTDLCVEIGFVVIIPSLLYIIARFLKLDRGKAAVIATVLLFPTLYVGSVRSLLVGISGELDKLRYAIPLTFIVPCFLIWHIWRSEKSFIHLHRWMVTTLTILLISEGILALSTWKIEGSSLAPRFDYEASGFTPVPVNTIKRDIVYILLDAHTSAGSLQRLWKYNEKEFIDSLEKKGFRVTQESRSLSAHTIRSQASTLNMSNISAFAYLPARTIYDLINHSTVCDFFSSQGYDIQNFSPFELQDRHKYYRIASLEEQKGSEWMRFFYSTLPVQVVNQYDLWQLPQKFNAIRSEIIAMRRLVRRKPTFFYAHFLSPHPPNLYDSTGGLLPYTKRKPDNDKSGYLENLRGNDKIVLRFIDSIMFIGRDKPIIILQGDHGSRLFNGTDESWELYTILNAYYLPECDSIQLPQNISPYNSYRVILNSYYGQHLTMLENGVHW